MNAGHATSPTRGAPRPACSCTGTRARRTPSATARQRRHQRRSVGARGAPERVAQRLVLLVGVVDVEHDAHRRDEHLARGERAENADADPPVEAERRERRLDEVAEAAGQLWRAGRRASWPRASSSAARRVAAPATRRSIVRARPPTLRAAASCRAGSSAAPTAMIVSARMIVPGVDQERPDLPPRRCAAARAPPAGDTAAVRAPASGAGPRAPCGAGPRPR